MSNKGRGFLQVSGVAAALALALATAACEGDRASQDGPNPGGEPDTPPEEEHDRDEIAHHNVELGEEGSEIFDDGPLGEAPRADLSVVDQGADVTSFQLEVTGFAENDFFLATAHVEPCGSEPEDSGELYEGDEDIEEAPEDETDQGSVMIQLGTDADGHGTGQIQLDAEPDGDDIGSMVISTDPTAGSEEPAPGEGEPIACMDVELDT